MNAYLKRIALATCLLVAAGTAHAQQEIRIGLQFGIAFLPFHIMDDLKLIEKHAASAGLTVKAVYQKFSGSGASQDALLSGATDIASYGVPGLLIGWDKARDTPLQIFAISGVSDLPMVLVSNQPHLKSLRDFTDKDRIAMPSFVSPQMYVLQMQSERVFGASERNKLRNLIVNLPNPEALSALLSGKTEVTAFFAAPPFAHMALKDKAMTPLLASQDVFGGKASFNLMAATKRYITNNPQVPTIVANAMDDAAALIKSDPRRAAEIYLKFEPSKTETVDSLQELLVRYKDDFGSSVHGIQVYADFMGRVGQIKNPPKSWTDVVAPSLARRPGS